MMRTRLLAAGFCVFSLSSCSWLAKESRSPSSVRIQLPAKRMSSAPKTLSDVSKFSWGVAAPAAVGEIDCYAVFVQAADLESGTCTTADGAVALPISRLFGQFAAGSSVSVDVPSGTGRTIGVFAFKSASGSCSAAMDPNFDKTQYSSPLFIGSTTMDLTAGDNTANISVSLSGAKPVDSCHGGYFANLVSSTWPNSGACRPLAANVSYTSGSLKISGSCLDSATSVAVKDTTTSAVTSLNLASKTSTSIVANLVSNFVVAAGHSYQLLITTASAQVAVPFTLTLSAGSLPVNTLATTGATAGQVIGYNGATGQAEWQSAPGAAKTVYLKDGTTTIGRLISLWGSPAGANFGLALPGYTMMAGTSNMGPTINYNQLSAGGPAYFVPWSAFRGRALNPSVPESMLVTYLQGPYFSNPDCTGDMYFRDYQPTATPVSSADTFFNKIYPMLSGCSGSGGSCASLGYQKLLLENLVVTTLSDATGNAPATYQSQVVFNPSTSPNLNGFICQSATPNLSGNPAQGYLLTNSPSNVVQPGAGDLPGIVANPTVGY